jgi:hypothetical protein
MLRSGVALYIRMGMKAPPRQALCLAMAVASAIPVLGADEDPPPEIARFAPAGFQTLDFAVADLDSDGRQDAVLILRRTDEDDPKNGEAPRPLLLLIRQPDGRLAQARRTERLVYCRSCGGMMGDPYESLTAGRGRFTVSFAGGSASSHWAVAYTFAYDAASKDWLLENEKNAGDDRNDQPTESDREGDERSSWTTVLTRRQLGDIPLDRFDYEASQKPKDWRVRSERAYFYERPDLGSRPRSSYVVRGDRVEGFRELRDFVEARFISTKDRLTYGYLLKKDLEPTGR